MGRHRSGRRLKEKRKSRQDKGGVKGSWRFLIMVNVLLVFTMHRASVAEVEAAI